MELHPVYINQEAISHLKQLVEEKNGKFIIVDENSLQHCLPQLISKVEVLKTAEIIELESGEEHKNIDVCVELWEALSNMKIDRSSLIINLGGGVVSDLGGFVAATYKRGIDFIQIPTTLLAQVDASIGGKVGVDLDSLKNQVGVFSEPLGVFILTDLLETLPQRELLSGFAEVIKHALIANADYWKMITAKNALGDNLEKIIRTSIKIKSEIVQADPHEKGLRKILNFGHTIGHAIESYSMEHQPKRLLHGEAIAIGMICEAYLSYKHNGLAERELKEITSFIISVYGIIKVNSFDDDELIFYMKQDKKNKGDGINFSLLTKIGGATVDHHFDKNDISEALNYYRKQTLITPAFQS